MHKIYVGIHITYKIRDNQLIPIRFPGPSLAICTSDFGESKVVCGFSIVCVCVCVLRGVGTLTPAWFKGQL